MNYVPYILEQTESGERGYDIYSRLLKDRIILLTGEINDDISSVIVSQLLYLDSVNTNDISLYINSPGGSITAGMAIYDTIHYINSRVNTICIGMAMSMGAFLLASTSGKRYALPHSEIMIHQPYGGMQGVVSDIDIQAKRLIKTKEKIRNHRRLAIVSDYLLLVEMAGVEPASENSFSQLSTSVADFLRFPANHVSRQT